MIVRILRRVGSRFSGSGGKRGLEVGGVAGGCGVRGVTARLFYRYGLFSAWHPHTLAVVVLLLAAYLSAPLVSVHLPSYWSHSVYVSNKSDHRSHTVDNETPPSTNDSSADFQDTADFAGEAASDGSFRQSVWHRQKPYIYLLQVIVRSAVVPWREELSADEAYRSALTLSFHLTETVANFQHKSTSLTDVCFRVDEPTSFGSATVSELLPRYNCLVLSPALLWKNSLSDFASDTSPGRTLRQAQRQQFCSGYSLCDLMFGLHTRSYAFTLTSSGQRPVVMFSVSLLLKQVNQEYVTALRRHLSTVYPTHQAANSLPLSPTIHWYFPHRRSLLLPLCVLLFCSALAVYMYFSLKKMPALHGKRRMAVYTMTLLLATIGASCGQLTLYDSGWSRGSVGGDASKVGGGGIWQHVNDWLPYCYPLLLGFVTFENAVHLTSLLVISDVPPRDAASPPLQSSWVTPRVRLARAVGGAGRWLVANFIQQMSLLSLGLCSGVPLVQRVCVPGVVGLLSDLLLQLGFFLPLLCADARRQLIELASCHSRCDSRCPHKASWSLNTSQRPGDDNYSCQVCLEHGSATEWPLSFALSGWTGSNPPPSLSASDSGGYWLGSSDVWSRRVRLFVMWSRVRLVQRVVSCLLVATMLWAACNTGTLATWRTALAPSWTIASTNNNNTAGDSVPIGATPSDGGDNLYLQHGGGSSTISRDTGTEPAPHFWAALLRHYNVSVEGRRLTLLPPVRLSVPLERDMERPILGTDGGGRRVEDGRDSSAFPLNIAALRQGSDHPVFTDDFGSRHARSYYWAGDYIVFFDGPKDLQDYALLALLTLPSLVFLVYVSVRLYRCLCPRNYAEWRSSWSHRRRRHKNNISKNRSSPAGDGPVGPVGARGALLAGLAPLRLLGHRRAVECLCVDGELQLLVSCCLKGELRVWQPMQGRCLRMIDRQSPMKTFLANKSDCDDSVSCHFPSGEMFPPAEVEDKAVLEQKLRHRRVQIRPDDLTSCSHETNLENSTANDLSINSYFHVSSLPSSSHSSRSSSSSADNDGFLPRSLPYSSALPGSGAPPVSPPSVGVQTVWCLDFRHLLVVAAGSAGVVEVWDALDACLMLLYGGVNSPVTHIQLLRSAVCAFRLDGSITIHKLSVICDGAALSWSRFTDIRSSCRQLLLSGHHYCTRRQTVSLFWSCHSTLLAHQLPLSAVRLSSSQQLQLLVTASADCTLKVFGWSEDQHTLTEQHHLLAHCAPVTACCVDHSGPPTQWRHVISGSADGALCVWDLMTGVCLYSMLAHDGSVLSLSTSESCLLSMGGDGRMCVWERYAGTLISTVPLSHCYCPQSLMLSPSVCVTSRQGSLVFWDIELGKPIRLVKLGESDSSVFVQQMALMDGAVACDYGCEIRVVRFPRSSGSLGRTFL